MADLAELLVRIDATTETLRRELKRGDQAVADSARVVETQAARINKSFQSTAASARINSQGLMSLQASGVNAFQALASGMSPFRVAMTEGAQVLGALVQGGILTLSNALGLLKGPLGLAAIAAGGLATAYFALRDDTVDVAEAQKTFQDALDKTNAYLDTAAEKAKRLAEEQKQAALATQTLAAAAQTELAQSLERQIAKAKSSQEQLERSSIGAGGQGLSAPEKQAFADKIAQLTIQLQSAEAAAVSAFAAIDRILSAGGSGNQRDDASKAAAKDDKKAFDDLIDSLVKTGEARDKARQAIDDQVTGLRTEATAVAESERARFIANEALKAERTLRQSQLDSHEIEDRIALVKQEAAANYDASEAAKARDKATKEAQRLDKKRADELGHLFESSFDRVGAAITEMSLEGQDAFKDLANVGKAIASEIAQDFIKLAAINPLKNALFGGNSPTLGDAGGLFGKIGNFFTGAGEGGTFGGVGNGPAFRAGGGSVSASSPYIVGEKGPELFIPHTAGAVVANDRLGGGGGPVFNIDARGASVDAVVRLEKMVRSLNGSIEGRAVAAVADYSRRGR